MRLLCMTAALAVLLAAMGCGSATASNSGARASFDLGSF